MINIYNNKASFLQKKPKYLFLVFLLLVLSLIILLVLAFKIKIYDNYQTKGYVTCDKSCVINTIIPTDIDFNKIKLNNKDLAYELGEIEVKVDEENFISYYNISLITKDELTTNEIVTLNFYYNKQRIIKKIIKKIF